MLSFVLSYSSTVRARPMGFNPNAIQPPQQPQAFHNKDEVSNAFGDTHTKRSSTMKNEQISTATAENKPPYPLKVTIQGRLGDRHGHGMKEAETLADAAKIFSKRPTESKSNDNARMKKDVVVMAFRPSSSSHSPGIGHDGPPDPKF